MSWSAMSTQSFRNDITVNTNVICAYYYTRYMRYHGMNRYHLALAS